MNPDDPPPHQLTETYWRGIILTLSVAVILFSIWCLTHGITTIFMHLYYFPIVLLAYRYRWKGFGLATLLAFTYLVLVIVFDAGNADVILGAFYRFWVFVGIGAIIAYLANRLVQVQGSLQQSAEITDRYLSLAPAIVLTLDRNGAITYLNKKGGEILKCNPAEVTGKPWTDRFIPENERERVKQVLSRMMDGQVASNRVFENPVLTSGGMEKSIRWSNAVLHDENGAITGLLSFGEDITEEKWQQDTLRELQQFQENVIANANVWISVLAPDGNLLVWNDAAEAISGYKKTGVLGKRTIWKKLYPDREYRKKVTGEIGQILGRDTYLENFETEIQCADATKKTIVWNTRALRDNAGTITGYIAIGRDVTAQKSAESRAGESSRFLAAMINTLPLPVFFKDAEGKYLGCNPPFEKYIGITCDELMGKTAYDISPRDLADKYTAADRQVLDDPLPQNYETQVQYADGSRHDVIFYQAPFLNKDGSVGGLIGAFLDITERKRDEKALILSEQKFHSYVDNSPVGIFVADGAGHYTDVNSASCNLLGYSREEMLSMNILDLALPEERQQTLDQFISIKEKLKTDSAVSFEMRLKKKDGSACPVILSVVKLPSDAIMGFALDITERKQIEESLRESEERFRTMMNWTYDWEYWIAPDRDVVYCSPSIQHITGYSAEEFIADKVLIDRIIHPDDHPFWEGHIPLHTVNQEEKKPSEIDFRIIAKDGSLHWIRHTCRAIFADDGRWIGRRISNRDITEQKQAEKVLWESEERYRSLAESITDNIFIIDRDDTIRFVNTHAAETLHLPADEIVGKPRKKFFSHDVADHQGMILQKVFESGEPSRNEERVVFGNQEFWQDNVLIPLKDETGNVTSVIGVSRDITERKRVELELASAYENLKEAYRLAHIGTWNWVMENDKVTWSEELYNIAGKDPSLPAPTYTEMPRIYTPASWDLLNAAVTNALNTGKPYNLELELIRADGSIRWINAFGGVKRDDTGKVIGLNGTLQDITERKQAEEEIRISNVILKTQQETSPDGILIVDRSGKILSFNHRFTENWGIPQDVIDSRSDERALSFVMDKLADPEEFLSRVRYLYEHPQEKSQEEILLKDGKVFDRYSAPMLGEDNRYFGRVWYFHDITERKRAEEAIRSREEQFRAIFQTQQTGLIMVDAITHTITDANDAALAMIGASHDEVVGKVCHTFICPAEMGKCPVTDQGQTVDSSERVLIRANGERIPILKSVNPVTIGNRPFLIESFIDLTERKRMEAEVTESRQLFADIISFLPDPTFVIDNEGKVLAWNRAIEELSGVPAEDIIGKGDHEYSLWQYGKRRPILIDLVLHPDQDAGRLDYTGIHWEGDTVTAQTEITLPGREQKISLSLVASPLLDAQEKVAGAIESIRDISSLREAEAALARLNANLEVIVKNRTRALEEEVAQRMHAEKDVQAALSYTRSVIEANPDLMVVLDRNGTILDINAAAEFLTGIPRDQLIGTPYFGYLVDDGTLYTAFSRLLESGMLENAIHIRHTDGHVTPLSVNATMIGGRDATDARIIVSAHDITRQKQDEEAIRSSRQMLTNVVENFPGVVFWKDKNSVYIGCNRNFSDGAGLKDPAEIIGKTDFDLPWAKTEAESYRSFDREVIERGKSRLHIIETQLQSDGRIIWLDTNKIPLFGPDGTVIGILGTSNDITRQKHDEENIKASLEEKVILLREVHHRVKNNLQIIISLVNLQMRQTDDPMVKQIMSETQNRVRAMSLVHEKLYRSESLSRIDFADYTRFLATQLFSFYGMDTRRVQLDFAMGKIMVDINTAIPLGLLLNELISNALKHAFPNGREGAISISGGYEEDLITLVVRDNGAGIPADFEWKNTTSLGMRLVTSLIDQVDGTIELDRTNGTVFTITVKRETAEKGAG
jgi:PAS domain S-box-containing protein